MRKLLLFAVVWLGLPAALVAGPKVEIVVGEKAPALEKRAAEEVSALLKRLYQAEVTQSATPSGTLLSIFIGSPATNPSLEFARADWPKLSDQGHILKSTKHRDQPALLIGGGSPVATYWAAAEFAHHLGVRTMLYGDLDPIAPPEFSLAGIDLTLEPQVRIRGWKLSYFGASSYAFWSQADQVHLLGQLAKLKYNDLVIRVSAGEPFIHFEAAGIRRVEGKFWPTNEYPVDGDTAGRSAFAGAKVFQNPDLAKARNEKERVTAGQMMLRGIVTAAHRLGMKVTLHIEPYDLPPEFDRHKVFADPDLAKNLARATVREYIHVCPEIDALMIGISNIYPETPKFFADEEIWQRPDLSRITPRAFARREPDTVKTWLKTVPNAQEIMYDESYRVSDPAKSLLELELGDWRDQPLPQIANALAIRKLRGLQEDRWKGFQATADESIGCLDLGAYLLSRNSFGADLSAEQACEVLLTPICGLEVHTRVSKAFAAVEHSTTRFEVLTAINDPSPGYLQKKYEEGEPAPAYWTEVKDSYLSAMNEMYRANTRAREGSRSYTLYLARQFEFGFEYMNCLQAVRNAGVARKAKDKQKQVAELEKAIDSINSACNALAAVARSNSDRGMIALLNAQVYRPLVKELAKVEAEE